jgi:hypothetical protein
VADRKMSYGNGYMPNYNMGMNNYNLPSSMDNRLNQLNDYMNRFNMNNQQQIQPQQQSSNMSFIKVANLQQAKEWVVQNNQEVWMQDSSEPYLYYKSVDNLGSANFRILKVDDVTEQMLNGTKQQNIKQEIDLSQYVPISNFNELQNQVKGLNDRLNMYEGFINNLINKPKENVVVEMDESKKVGRPKSNSTPKVGD